MSNNAPSLIVHGPQGCGKTTNAERLRQHFRCARVQDECDIHVYWQFDERASTLYLTQVPPPPEFEHSRRVVSFEHALNLAGA